MHKLLMVVLVTACCCHAVQAQDMRLSLSPELNIPLGKMAWSYKPSIGAQLAFSKVDPGGDILSAYGISLSYTSLTPQADTLYYVVDEGGVGGASLGKAAYSAFQMLHLKASLDWAFPIGKKMAFTLGAGLGIIYGRRSIYFEDATGSDDSSELVGWGTLNPSAGFEFILSENFSLVPYVSYTVMLQLGSTDSDALNYNPGTGSFYHFYSPGISLNYSF
jgi:hypothetical protein